MLCPMSFNYRSLLLRHLAKHVEPLWRCNECNLKFNREDTLDRHMLIHLANRPEYNCKLCQKKYKQLSSLNCHMSHKHSKQPPSFNCNLCQKSFASKKSLRYHLNVHKSIKPFQCTICNEKFCQPYEKSRHIKTMVIYKI